MRHVIPFALSILLVAGPTPAADQPVPRPVESPKPLTAEARAELRGLLPEVAKKAKARFPEAALTIEQARHYANVPAKLTWQAEYAGWFVFGVPGQKGTPDRWSGIVFVQKGTNMVGFYQETW